MWDISAYGVRKSCVTDRRHRTLSREGKTLAGWCTNKNAMDMLGIYPHHTKHN
uniref:Uncharacterized protein n=1 Tax=Setaria italica TaxID=4555 RepID=K4A0I7_SETIT